jgi:hypothetical protein
MRFLLSVVMLGAVLNVQTAQAQTLPGAASAVVDNKYGRGSMSAIIALTG